ncbi:MAG TPA: PrsW family glutamic-type intramembrane protease [Ktedonobacterales bacterium]|nr:PrsW family glutamic-type intramembrane protease [Ktedonobacterales bacterium]
MSSRFCSHCGFEAEASDQVCKVCGATLPALSGPEAPTLVKSAPAPQPAEAPPVTSAAAGVAPTPAEPMALPAFAAVAATPVAPVATTPQVMAPAAPIASVAPVAATIPQAPVAPSPWPSAPPAVAPSVVAAAYPPTPAYYSAPAQAQAGAPASAMGATPGYPAYAQGAYPPAPYGYGGYGYPYGYGYAYPYYYPYPAVAPRKPGELYAKIISWIVFSLGIVGVLSGIIAVLIFLVSLSGGGADNLSTEGALAGFVVGPLVGGALAIYYGLTGAFRRPSPTFALPPAWLIGALALVAFAAGVTLWNLQAAGATTPGAALGVLPLAIFCGVLPAFTILAFASQRLGNPSTRRITWMSLLYGLTIAPLLASILELILTLIIANVLQVNSLSLLSNSSSPQTPAELIGLFLVLSVVAPLVEEGLKPLGAVMVIGLLRSPAEAFLVGLAGGIGFDMFETVGYIGSGQADWIYVAIERVGAGLLHGVGAGMSALGWYYLIRGKGVRLRWLKGFGCGVYAVLQHAIFNGVNLLPNAFPSLNQPFNYPLYLGRLPFESAAIMFFVIYALILTVLILVTGRIRETKQQPVAPPTGAPGADAPLPQAPLPQPVGGGVR